MITSETRITQFFAKIVGFDDQLIAIVEVEHRARLALIENPANSLMKNLLRLAINIKHHASRVSGARTFWDRCSEIVGGWAYTARRWTVRTTTA